jgi:hypothetical protein
MWRLTAGSSEVVLRVAVVAAVGLVLPSDLRAQQLAGLLPELILRGITLPAPATTDLSHVAHFSPFDANELTNPAVEVVENFNTLMRVQLSTFPLGSSAGGLTYAFDDSLGTLRRGTVYSSVRVTTNPRRR